MVELEDTTSEIEIWKPVVGHEGVYSVSNRGRVRRDAAARKAVPGRILDGFPNEDGYIRVTLSGPRRTVAVHILVAHAFIGPRPDGHEVNHKNGQKTHNAADNLEYVTHLENIRHAVEVLDAFAATRARGDRSGARMHPERLARGDRNGSRLHPDSRPRGDQNGSRLYPERLTRGDEHWSRLHPEQTLRGARNGRAKATEAMVRVIRASYAAGGRTHLSLATDHGLSEACVARIVNRKTWVHVE